MAAAVRDRKVIIIDLFGFWEIRIFRIIMGNVVIRLLGFRVPSFVRIILGLDALVKDNCGLFG